jgi:hypothetical protein
MDEVLKARLIGAAVLVAIAVLLIPLVAARFFDAIFQVFERTWSIASPVIGVILTSAFWAAVMLK